MERQGIQPEFEPSESSILLLQKLQPLHTVARFDPQPLGLLLNGVNGSPIQPLLPRRLHLRQQMPRQSTLVILQARLAGKLWGQAGAGTSLSIHRNPVGSNHQSPAKRRGKTAATGCLKRSKPVDIAEMKQALSKHSRCSETIHDASLASAVPAPWASAREQWLYDQMKADSIALLTTMPDDIAPCPKTPIH